MGSTGYNLASVGYIEEVVYTILENKNSPSIPFLDIKIFGILKGI